MTRLIINADDLGMHPSIDAGIVRAKSMGVLTSASLMVTGASAQEAVARARGVGLGIGVHLTLSQGSKPAAPPSSVSTIAPGGRFPAAWPAAVANMLARGARWSQIAAEVDGELRAQIALARALGAAVDHLDSHHHLHMLPWVQPIVRRIAADEGVPLRWPRERPRLRWLSHPGPAAKSLLLSALSLGSHGPKCVRVTGLGIYYAGRLDERRLLTLLNHLPEGVYEMGCHPGDDTQALAQSLGVTYQWRDELHALTSPRVRDLIERRRIRLCTYADLAPRETAMASSVNLG